MKSRIPKRIQSIRKILSKQRKKIALLKLTKYSPLVFASAFIVAASDGEGAKYRRHLANATAAGWQVTRMRENRKKMETLK